MARRRAHEDDPHVVALPAEDVHDRIAEVLNDPRSTLVFLIARRGDEIVMPAIGGPSAETLAILEAAVAAYRAALEGGVVAGASRVRVPVRPIGVCMDCGAALEGPAARVVPGDAGPRCAACGALRAGPAPGVRH